MSWYFIVIFSLGSLLSAVVLLATKNGSKAAQLEALKLELKKQAKEQAHAQKIRNRVSVMDEHTVRQRLHQLANKQH